MTHLERLKDALLALGYNEIITSHDGLRVAAQGGRMPMIQFSRSSASAGFATRAEGAHISAVGKKYAELGVREWARRAGYNVADLTEDRMTLINRRAR